MLILIRGRKVPARISQKGSVSAPCLSLKTFLDERCAVCLVELGERVFLRIEGHQVGEKQVRCYKGLGFIFFVVLDILLCMPLMIMHQVVRC